MTNPDNFTAHRKALMRLSEICGSLTSAFLITKDTHTKMQRRSI